MQTKAKVPVELDEKDERGVFFYLRWTGRTVRLPLTSVRPLGSQTVLAATGAAAISLTCSPRSTSLHSLSPFTSFRSHFATSSTLAYPPSLRSPRSTCSAIHGATPSSLFRPSGMPPMLHRSNPSCPRPLPQPPLHGRLALPRRRRVRIPDACGSLH